MSDNFFGLPDDFPSMEEQDAIKAHNKPILDAIVTAGRVARELFGWDSPEFHACVRIREAADKLDANFKRIEYNP